MLRVTPVQWLRQQSVVRYLVTLLAIALVSLTAIIGANVLAAGKLRQLDDLLANEKVKLDLNNMLQQRLLRLRNELQAISFSSSAREYGVHDRTARVLLDDILAILHVLEKGGAFEDRYLVNFGNEEEIVRSIEYRNINQGRLELESIELKSHLEELQELSREFSRLIFLRDEQKRSAAFENDGILDKKILFFFKGFQPFFGRILENANRIYHESQNHLKQIDETREQVSRQAKRWVLLISCGTVLVLVSAGTLVLRDVRRIQQERNLAMGQLLAARENLEKDVAERTQELSRSNAQLREEVRERQQAQETIRSQADFLHSTIEALDHPFYVVDAEDYRVVLKNSAAERLTDGGQTYCYQLSHRRSQPCDGKEHPCPLQEVRRTGKPCLVEHVHCDQDGEPSYVEIHGYPLFDETGRVVRMIEYSLDISEKKAAELALQRSNEELEERVAQRTRALAEEATIRLAAQQAMEKTATLFRHLIENAPGVVLIVEPSGMVRYISPSVSRLAGYLPMELAGHSFFAYTHDEDDDRIEPLLHLPDLPDKAFSLEFRFRHRDGHWIEVDSVIISHLDEPSVDGIVVNLWDISEHKQTENRLRQLSQVVEQSSNSVVITDTEGVIQYVNSAFVATTGYTPEEALGHKPSLLQSGMTPARVYREMWDALIGGREWRGEFVNRKKNGEIYEESVLVAPIRDKGGRVTQYIATKENITELKKARQQAEEASRVKSAFLANMSHEIRTPLNGIIGFLDLLARRGLNETQQHYVEVIRKSASQLLFVINDVLDLAKVESGRLQLDSVLVDLTARIEPAIEVFYARAGEKRIEFLAYIDPELPLCLVCDVQRLNQVLANLINNAIKFTPEGGRVNVEILCQETTATSCRVLCRVSDSGIGIAAEKQQEIFLPFAQADNSTTRQYGGTGLGLTISKNLVELMGGELHLESVPGRGSTFSFQFNAETCPSTSGRGRERLQDVPEFVLLQAGGAPRGPELLLSRYLRAMHGCLRPIPLNEFVPPDSGVVLAVLDELSREDAARLGRQGIRHLILVVEPGCEDEVAVLCPGATVLSQPLNSSKIHDAVALCLGRHRPQTGGNTGQGRLFAGCRVLVAEDNRINQELVSLVLQEMGISSDIAANGVEALALFRGGGYDLVLMDVNMPEMDGIEATKQFLALEREQGRAHIPIVALTAHAFKEERLRILEAGMDNYLTKPLDQEKMRQVLGLYLRSTEPGRASAATAEPMARYDAEAAAKEIGVKPAVLRRMLGAFQRQLDSAQDALEGAVAAGDRQAVRRELHSLSGAAANLRLREFAGLLAAGEQQLRQPGAVELGSLVERVIAAGRELRLHVGAG